MKKLNLTTFRRTFQIFIALAFIIIPLLNRSRYSMVYGNFLSFHMFGIPFADPLAVLQLTIKNWYFTLDNFIGTLLPLLLALVLGTVFCSWVCPYGLFSELTQKIRKKILPRNYKGLPLSKNGFTFKMGIFILGFIGFFVFSTTPILNQLSTAAWYSRFFQYYFGQDIISLCFLFLMALLLIEFFAGKRLWCRYICPQSILIILTKLINRKRLKVVFTEEKCICKTGYDHCEMACTLGLKPKSLAVALETECSNCGDCVVACKKMGKALSFNFLGKRTGDLANYFPGPLKIVKWLSITVVVAGLGILLFTGYQKLDLASDKVRIDHKLLSNKQMSWNSDKFATVQLLANGEIVVSGGQWPLDGSANWQWQPVDKHGSFKVIPVASQPDSYTLIKVNVPIDSGIAVNLEHIGIGISEEFPDPLYKITELVDITTGDKPAAASVEGQVILSQYANQVFVLTLEVKDPVGIIKKIESEGDHIGFETMLTSVKKFINSPEIIVSDGEPPQLPFVTRMNVIFHDGHTESMRFETGSVIDRSSEEFDDPWF